jgi:myo-inositol-1(or 4)-monophosphatase
VNDEVTDRPSHAHLARLRALAEGAALAGTRVIIQAKRPTEVEAKSAGDYVTEVDRESEAAIRDVLRRATPDIPILGEETGGDVAAEYWAVDPLDGTRNFLLGFPVVGVSVALVRDGRPQAAAVLAPFLGLSFSAARGLGATSKGGPVRVSARPPGEAIVATGFPFRRKERLAEYLPAFEHVLRRAEDLRRAGAASLDLAWVAAGVFDGFFELGLSVWDVAAGALLVEEAGGTVTDWGGGREYLAGDILAGSPATHPLLLEAAFPDGKEG